MRHDKRSIDNNRRIFVIKKFRRTTKINNDKLVGFDRVFSDLSEIYGLLTVLILYFNKIELFKL
jgi:hypothetical protein